VGTTQRDQDTRAIHEAVVQLGRESRRALITKVTTLLPDLTPAAFAVMTRIVDRPKSSPAHLVDATGFDKSVVSRLLASLAKGGYLVSEPSPRDGRVTLFSPTEGAVAKIGAVTAASHRDVADAVADWTEHDVSTFAELMTKYLRSAYGA
jgi:DNA-binding MarR family transcriptional regulator